MDTVKIQINHAKSLTLDILATLLYSEIGEEYDLELDEINGYFNFLSTNILLDDSFITVLTFDMPELDLRDVELKGIVFSFLKGIETQEGIISITKVNDTILQKKAFEYYQKIADLEMDMRNVLTYIINYSTKSINDELFKNFSISKSEKIEHNNIKEQYENGLFYIYFSDYQKFTKPQKLKAEKIAEFLQEPNIQSFEQLKVKLDSRGLNEERHIDFIASIKTKLDPVEKMRNAIMHIRNISDTNIRNFEKAINDNGDEKGIKSLIEDFWNNEHEILKQKTFLKLSELSIKDIFYHAQIDPDGLLVLDIETSEILEQDYEELATIQDDIRIYIDDTNILNYDATESDYTKLDDIVKECWDGMEIE